MPGRWRLLWFASALSLAVSARGQATAFTYDAPGSLVARVALPPGTPAIVAPPGTQILSTEGNATFSVVASGSGPVSYQWLSNGVPIAGAVGDSLTISNVVVPHTILTNGSFEQPVLTNDYLTYLAGTAFGGWIVETGSVDHVRSLWQPAEGFQSMDMSGTTAGALYQDLTTTLGQQYYLRFALSGNPASGPTIKSNVLWWNGAALATNAFNITGRSVSDMAWTNYEYTVTATSNLTRLKFASLSAGGYGPALDEVSLIAVPPSPAQYSVIVSNASGSVTSSVATIQFDTDGNGLPDSWERTYFAVTGQSPDADSDGDGISNADEFLEGTNPTDAASFRPRLNLTVSPGGAAAAQPMRASYALNENVQLTAQPNPEALFLRWGGNLTNTNTTVGVVMDATKYINAIFGTTLGSGANYDGTVALNGTNYYAFVANSNDTIVLRCGELSGTALFQPWLRIYGTGATPPLLASVADVSDAFVAYRATNSGVFTVTVSSAVAAQTGDYRLHFIRIPDAFVVPPGDEGGPLTNGGNHSGTNDIGDEDIWSFTANAGDSIVLRCGEISGTASYTPWIRIYGTTGTLLAQNNNASDAFIAYQPTNSGTYTVLVGSAIQGHTGSYKLRFMQIPGAFIVPPGDEGGALTNGAAHDGVTDLGDEDIWTFSANKGDTVLLRCGEVTGTAAYSPWLRLYGPSGALLTSDSDPSDAAISYQTTNAGTFTVLVGSANQGHTGTYRLNFAQIPEPFVVAPGDEGGTLTNGAAHDGVTQLGDEDIWTFTANANDTVVLRCADLSGNPNYYPYLRLYSPSGAYLTGDVNQSDSWIVYRATNSGTFSVTVDSYYQGYSGNYRLRYVKVPGAFVVPPGDEGGPLRNGAAYDGTTELGDEDLWTLTANAGDTILLRCADVSSNASYYPYLRLYGSNGALLASDSDQTDSMTSYRATNSGTFTVLVGSYYQGFSGNYRLRLSQIPGAFVVPPGDEGGPLVSGGNYDGTNDLGDEDIWTFTANAGDNIVLRTADVSTNSGYYVYQRLYGPNGALLASDNDQADSYLAYQTTNSGTFTVVVEGLTAGATGNYRLHFMQMPGAFIVPAGDEGGALTPGVTNVAVTDLGDEDNWRFTAFKNVPISVTCQEISGTVSYAPWLRLYGPSGVFLSQNSGASQAVINYTPTNTGTFTVLAGSVNRGHFGTYRIYGSGFTAALQLGTPSISGSTLTIPLSGGYSNLQFTVSVATNLAPPVVWTPVRTNQFDAAGNFTFTNNYSVSKPQEFYRFAMP